MYSAGAAKDETHIYGSGIDHKYADVVTCLRDIRRLQTSAMDRALKRRTSCPSL